MNIETPNSSEPKPMPRKLAFLAASILQFCREHHIQVQYYESYTTNSIYIKMDYGVLNSIRISDHHGKKHLAYRYEIGPHIRKTHIKHGRWTRKYYTTQHLHTLFRDIQTDAGIKHLRYSTRYSNYMEANRRTHKKGFWKKAILIDSSEIEDSLWQRASQKDKKEVSPENAVSKYVSSLKTGI